METSDQFGFEGTKTFEEIITPQNADVHELPPVVIFILQSRRRQISHTHPTRRAPHRQSRRRLADAGAGRKPKAAPENQTPQDILPIKENLGTLAQAVHRSLRDRRFSSRKPCRCWHFSPRSSGANARTAWRTIRVCAASAQWPARSRRLDDLKKFAAANQPDEFFALLFRLLQEQLGERLDCPASAITENVIDEHPVLRGAPKATLDALRELFQLCNQARYAPVRGASELNSVAAKLEQTLSELQEVKA